MVSFGDLSGPLDRRGGNLINRPWGLGGSDIGAVLGLSPFKGPVQLWLEKVRDPRAGLGIGPHAVQEGQVVDECAVAPPAEALQADGPGPGLGLRFGRHLEPFVAEEYERQTGYTTHEHLQAVRHESCGYLFGHVDRLVSVDGGGVIDAQGRICTDTLLECKTASAFSAGQWGPAWGDQVPAHYLAQCLWYTTLTGCGHAHLAVLLGNTELRVYRIVHDPALGERLLGAACEFWERHVLAGVPPAARTRLEVELLHPREVSGSEVQASEGVLAQLRRLRRINELSGRLERESQRIRDGLAVVMQGAERITHDGKALATWRTPAPSRRLDVARLRRERPALAAEYTAESEPTRRMVLGGLGHA